MTVMGTDLVTATRMTLRPRLRNADLSLLMDLHNIAAYAEMLRTLGAHSRAKVVARVQEASLGTPRALGFDGPLAARFEEPACQGTYPPLERVFPAEGFDGPFRDEDFPPTLPLDLLSRLPKLHVPSDFLGTRDTFRESNYAVRFLPASTRVSASMTHLYRRVPAGSDLFATLLASENHPSLR